MKTLPQNLTAELATGVTTLCRCWLLTRRDGETLGLTDHDMPLEFDGVTYLADAGMRTSALERNHHLAEEGMEVFTILSSPQLKEDELLRGLYDGAALTVWLVNWDDVASRVQLTQGWFGKVRREGAGFHVELQGPSSDLRQERMRVFRKSCDAVLGDVRCGVDLSSEAFRKQVPLWRVATPTDLYTFLGGVNEDGWFSGGTLLPPASHGSRRYEIRSSKLVNRQGIVYHHVRLWTPFPYSQAEKPRSVTLVPGCDKQFSTCRLKFSNVANFRGHPHLPGDSVLVNPVR